MMSKSGRTRSFAGSKQFRYTVCFSKSYLIMNQTYINQLKDHIGEEVTLKGWLYNSRSSGKLVFLQLRDGTGIVQCVVFKGNDEAVFEKAKVARAGIVDHRNRHGQRRQRSSIGVELDVNGLEVLQNVHDYPITPKEHGTEFLMDNRHLWIRSKKQHAVLKVRHTVIKAVRDYFDDNGFTLADTPIFTPAACEGTTTLFEVDYFGDDKAYLTQSASFTTKRPPRRSEKSMRSARRSAPKNQRRAAI